MKTAYPIIDVFNFCSKLYQLMVSVQCEICTVSRRRISLLESLRSFDGCINENVISVSFLSLGNNCFHVKAKNERFLSSELLITNFASWFGRLRQQTARSACCTCSTILFSSSNYIFDLCRRRLLNSLVSCQCRY